MKKNQFISLLINLITILILSIIIGFICSLFGQILIAITNYRYQNFIFLIWFLPIWGVLTVYIFKTYGKEVNQGMTMFIDKDNYSIINWILVPIIIITTWGSHLFGASVGREGVAVQLGGTIGNYGTTIKNKIYQLLKINNAKLDMLDNKQMTFIGMAIGFASLFHVPIAATIFVVEVTRISFKKLQVKFNSIIYMLIGSFLGSYISETAGLHKFSFLINDKLIIDINNFLPVILICLIFGLASLLFIQLLKQLKQIVTKTIPNPYIRIVTFSIVIIILSIIIGMGRYSGLGTNLIDASLNQSQIYIFDWLLKLLFTVLAISIGFQGGEVTPIFAIGATLGATLAIIFGLPIALIASLGYIALFAGCSNTILAPIAMYFSLFGCQNIILTIIIVTITFIISTNQSIYFQKK